MYKNRRNKNHNNWNNQQKNGGQKNNNSNEQPKQKKFEPSRTNYEDENVLKERKKAIQELKTRQTICEKCGNPILEIASALVPSRCLSSASHAVPSNASLIIVFL